MKIVEERVYTGPNIYAYKPVICLKVLLSPWQGIETKEIPNFNDNLVNLLPGLGQHHCSRGRPGGFLERLQEGTYLGHVIEHVALELSSLAGEEVFFGTTRTTSTPYLYNVVYAYETAEVGLAAGKGALNLVEALAEQKEAGQLLAEILAELSNLKRKHGFGPSTKALLSAAKERGIPWLPVAAGAVLQLGYGARAKRLSASLTSEASALAVDLACDKWATRCLLEESGLPVPEGRLAISWEEVEESVRELGFPLVVKPVSANQGKGVTTRIWSLEAARSAWERAKPWGEVLVEKEVQGGDYRLLVVGGKFTAASLRRPPVVVGDGKSTIGELIAKINAEEGRGEGHEKPLTKIPQDEIAQAVLKAQGYNLNSIPSRGVEVKLRYSGNLSTGGTAVDVTDLVHPQTRELAERAARLLKLDVAGVDLICKEISLSLAGQGAIIEVNAAPGLRMHLHPSEGEGRPVAHRIISHLFPEGDGRIPLIAVTGTNGKTTTVRMIGHVLAKQGMTVGQTTTDGIYLAGKLIVPGDNTGPWSAQVLLRDPAVEAAVLEVARGGILQGGLGYDKSQVAVITNLSDDHLGLGGIETLEELAQVKSLVAECVLPGGWVVLNADDHHVAAMAERVAEDVNILFFSCKRNNKLVKKHLKRGGAALWLEGGKIVWQSGPLRPGRFWAQVHNYPATLGGELAHNTANLLAAIGGLLAFGLPPSQIEEALLEFPSDPVCNPGRFNVFQIGSRKVIVDYGRNPAGYRTALLAAKKITTSLTGIIGAPGDRRDETIRTMGEIAARYCQRLIIKEDQNLRGRDRGEVARLLKEGALAGGSHPEKIKIIYDEVKALHYALSQEGLGDVIIFYESWPSVHREIALFSAIGAAAPREVAAKSEAK